MEKFLNLSVSGGVDRCDLRDHGGGPGAHVPDLGDLQLRTRRGRVHHRIPLLRAARRPRHPDRVRADHLRVHLRSAARTARWTGSCCVASPTHRCTRGSSARSDCSSPCRASRTGSSRRSATGCSTRARPTRPTTERHPDRRESARLPQDRAASSDGIAISTDQLAVLIVAAVVGDPARGSCCVAPASVSRCARSSIASSWPAPRRQRRRGPRRWRGSSR